MYVLSFITRGSRAEGSDSATNRHDVVDELNGHPADQLVVCGSTSEVSLTLNAHCPVRTRRAVSSRRGTDKRNIGIE